VTSDTPRFRLGIIAVVAMSLFAALFARLWYLQVLSAPDFRAQAQLNSIRTVEDPAPRGRILDRNGKVIVDTLPRIQNHEHPWIREYFHGPRGRREAGAGKTGGA
jgi:penicillin-binding protein 2